MPLSTATAVEATLLPSVQVVDPPVVLNVGVSLTGVTLTQLVAGALLVVPSNPTKAIARTAVLGESLVLVKVTVRRAACHSARVAVAPVETRVRTPPAP